MNKLFTDMEQQ